MRYPTQPTTDQGNTIGSRMANEIEHRFNGAMRILSKDDQRDSSIAELLAGTGEVVNVKSFGALGDGTTDDTAAIQAAIDALAHSGGVAGAGIPGVGGVIYFPTGIYVTSAPLTINAADDLQNISLVGEGPLASVIRNDATAGENALSVVGVSGNSAHGLLIRDLGVHGNASSGVGIFLQRVIRQVQLERVDVKGHGTNGIEFTSTGNMLVIQSCRVRDNGTNGIRCSLNGEQVWLYGNSIRDNAIGISIGSFTNIFNVYGGDIHGNTTAGISLFGSETADGMVTAIEIRGVYFEQNNEDITIDNPGSTLLAGNILIAANSFSQTTPTAGSSRCIDVRRGQFIYIEHNEFRKITDSNIDACIKVDSEAEDVYIGPNWFPTSTTRTKLSIDGSATRTWGFTNPDNNAQEFNSWGPTASPVTTFGATDTTPTVVGGNVFLTHASTQTLTDFDDGVAGQEITVISKAAVTFAFSGDLTGSSASLVTASGDVTRWVCEDGTVWILLGYVDVSVDNSAGA